MFKNYFKTAVRNLRKQKFYAFINVSGLAIGIACCLLIVLYVQDELSYDKFNTKSDRIYRAIADIKFGSMDGKIAVVSAPMAGAMIQDYPEVETAVRFRTSGSKLVKRKDQDVDNIKETRFTFVDPEIFDVFTLNLLEGDLATVLTEPNTLILTKTKAEKYFPEGNAVGKVLTLDNSRDYKVVGVLEDIPNNSHFSFDFFLAMEGLADSKEPIWVSHNYFTYILLKPGADAEALEAKLPEMVTKYLGPQVEQFLNVDLDDFVESGNRFDYYLQPLTDIHLKSNLMAEIGTNGDITYVWLFGGIAVIILIIACINFMNLSTARSANRAREVGIRKVMGSVRGNLIGQFLVESVIVSIVAFALAILLAELLMPVFNNLSGKELSIPITSLWLLPALFIGSVMVGILAGIYPAFFLSAFDPINVLKGKLSAGSGSSWLRSTLVVMQFSASIALIVGTIVIYQQMNFVQNKKLGFNKDQVLIIHDTYVMGTEKLKTFKNELLNEPTVINASVSGFLPVENTNRNNTVFWPEGDQSNESQVLMQNWRVDHNYIPTLGMKMLEGRAFSLDFPTDSQAMILNETAAKNFNFDDPIGKRISTFTDFGADGTPVSESYTVIGIMEDFHFESLKENVTPLCFFIGSANSLVSVRMNTDDVASTLEMARAKWAEFAPGQPFSYSFLDERFTQMYEAEQRAGDILAAFAGLAIFVACLGLFALAAFMADQRTKEIGIRKVLGASVSNIMVLLSKDFLKMVAISLIVALPVAFYLMNNWLSDYAYRVELWDVGPWAALIAALVAIGIAILSVSSQAMRAAMTNPVHALKDN